VSFRRACAAQKKWRTRADSMAASQKDAAYCNRGALQIVIRIVMPRQPRAFKKPVQDNGCPAPK